jgi:GIY-YIG catalytic domain
VSQVAKVVEDIKPTTLDYLAFCLRREPNIDLYQSLARAGLFKNLENTLFSTIDLFFQENKDLWVFIMHRYILAKLVNTENFLLYEKLLNSFYMHIKAHELNDVFSLSISGVYLIIDRTSCIGYIGESKCIFRRFEQHRFMLLNGKHHNYKLQRQFDLVGMASLEFFVLAFSEELRERKLRQELELSFIQGWPGELFNIIRS